MLANSSLLFPLPPPPATHCLEPPSTELTSSTSGAETSSSSAAELGAAIPVRAEDATKSLGLVDDSEVGCSIGGVVGRGSLGWVEQRFMEVDGPVQVWFAATVGV